MSSQERKERRLKQQVKEGAAAIARVRVMETEYDQHKKLLSTAMDQLTELQEKYNELEESWAAAHAEAARFKASNGILERDHEQLMAANVKLRSDIQGFIADTKSLRNELREVKAADKDARKLRQRLAKRGEEIDKLQLELSKLKKERAAGW